jgi:hypothetical protein
VLTLEKTTSGEKKGGDARKEDDFENIFLVSLVMMMITQTATDGGRCKMMTNKISEVRPH